MPGCPETEARTAGHRTEQVRQALRMDAGAAVIASPARAQRARAPAGELARKGIPSRITTTAIGCTWSRMGDWDPTLIAIDLHMRKERNPCANAGRS